MLQTMYDLVKRAQALETKKLVVAVANDYHVLEAVEMARNAGIIEGVLVGNATEIKRMLADLKYKVGDYAYLDFSDPEEACREAVKLVRENKDYFLMKGFVDTSVILGAVLNKDYGLRTPNRLSHVSVLEIPTYHKLLLMSDGAMNIDPDVDIKQEIIENGVHIAKAIGIRNPAIGCIAAVEKVNPKMQATLDAEILVERYQNGRIKDCVIGGPFALDNAIDKKAAEHKNITDPIAGDVDFLLMPRIEAGNVFYKSMMFLANAKSASVIAGATKPIVLTSRADTKETKFYSIALGALVSELS